MLHFGVFGFSFVSAIILSALCSHRQTVQTRLCRTPVQYLLKQSVPLDLFNNIYLAIYTLAYRQAEAVLRILVGETSVAAIMLSYSHIGIILQFICLKGNLANVQIDGFNISEIKPLLVESIKSIKIQKIIKLWNANILNFYFFLNIFSSQMPKIQHSSHFLYVLIVIFSTIIYNELPIRKLFLLMINGIWWMSLISFLFTPFLYFFFKGIFIVGFSQMAKQSLILYTRKETWKKDENNTSTYSKDSLAVPNCLLCSYFTAISNILLLFHFSLCLLVVKMAKPL